MAILAGAAVSTVVTGATPAAAQDSLLSLSDLLDLSNLITVSPSVLTSCYQLGQGKDDYLSGTQTITCNQSATSSSPTPPSPPTGGGITGYEVVQGNLVTLAPNGAGFSTANCPAGKKAVGGGFSASQDIDVVNSNPLPDGSAWQVFFTNRTNTDKDGFAFAVCINAAS
ncbi:hypothetical protein QEZ54_01045 [Catellatospora sp. KI3]|uniref:hypothetical protein n=1 Tax=Catellatospora sp. KI3 TaxID=3041620 RepID=UPI0024829E5B|nr:hypothetical protein [Catellatospora sp. KI3]MDI1459542.1 hypothetical protein [Catellatospora sp. KI3]